MSYDEEDEEFQESKLQDIEFEKGDEEAGSITYASVVSFRYKGIDYDMAVDVTYSWDKDNPPDYDFDYLDDIPEELDYVWDEIRDKLNEAIIEWNKKRT